MEIKEILDFHINNTLQLVEVNFRVLQDEDDILRSDKISFSELESFGFGSIINSFEDSELDDDNDFDLFSYENNYDEYDILEFLNEYYLIFPERLPESKFY